jgi:dihydroorotase
MRLTAFRNFRIVDADGERYGTVLVEDGIITGVISGEGDAADRIIDGRGFGAGAVLMPAFIDLHAHFRDTAFPSETAFPPETVESASLAAASGGFGTVVCMANTKPPIDTIEKARALRERSRALGLVDLYPVLCLTKNMEGRELSGIVDLHLTERTGPSRLPLLLSEDGKDLADDRLFLAALGEARRLGIAVSCHCDFGGPAAAAAKAAGRPRAEWSRLEEREAVRRVIDLGRRADCHIHIAHVSTTEALSLIREAKQTPPGGGGFVLSCEASPHHIGADEDDARRMGAETYGRVNPPLRSRADRRSLCAAIAEGVIDAIATDHAPHSAADKAAGAPGFTGLETAFAGCYTTLAADNQISLGRLSRLMSAAPARILGLDDLGVIAPGLRADLVIADTAATWKVNPERFKSRGKHGPFTGRELKGKILVTINGGRVVFEE